MELEISLEAVCRIIQRAREIEAQVEDDEDEDSGSNPTDDGEVDVLRGSDDEEDNAVDEELRVAIDDLADDEQVQLIALTLVGRGDYELGEWPEALEAADDEMPDAVEFLTGLPMLSTELEAGLAAFGLNCDTVGTRG